MTEQVLPMTSVREERLTSGKERNQETGPTLALGGAANVVTRGHRRTFRTFTVPLVMVLALVLLLTACSGTVNESKAGTVNGKIAESELGVGASASATFNLAPGKYVLICNIRGHYKDGMFTAFQVIDEADSEGAVVNVELGEWFVRADNASVKAGPITFDVSNIGGESHELVIIQTDLAPDDL